MKPINSGTFSQHGFRMPAEWEPHAATWVSWPHKEESWPGKFEKIPPIYAQMVKHLARSEPVHINVADAEMESHARRHLDEAGASGEIHFHHFPTNDAWCRDHGAIIVKNADGDRHALDWQYNAWGEKYPPFDLDNQIPSQMADALGLPCTSIPLVLEGGSIDVNGQSVLLTTESCLLNPNRNPQFSKREIEQTLKDFFGVTEVWWLGDGIVGDDTDGHIDDLTRFVNPNTVVTVVESNPNDVNYQPLEVNRRRLESFQLDGNPLNVIELPMPSPVEYDGERLPASYANFYIANRLVLVPTYNCPADAVALDVLGKCFPNREIVGLDCTDLVWGLGAFHCLTQQIPA